MTRDEPSTRLSTKAYTQTRPSILIDTRPSTVNRGDFVQYGHFLFYSFEPASWGDLVHILGFQGV